jgi:hypothetical protein
VELHKLYASPNEEGCDWWAGHVARMGETRNVEPNFGGKPEGNRP